MMSRVAKYLKKEYGTELDKYQVYELVFTRLSFLYVIASIIYYFGNRIIEENASSAIPESLLQGSVFVLLAIILLSVKLKLLKNGWYERKAAFYFYNFLWLSLILLTIVYWDIGKWNYALILSTIAVASMTKGVKPGLALLSETFLIHICMLFTRYFTNGLKENLYASLLNIFILYVIFGLFAFFNGLSYNSSIENDIQNKSLMEQLEEKYIQLEAAQNEIKKQYDELKAANTMLEDTNRKLSENVAEFYTLQRISQAIGSILDIKELLKYLNDIIIGVMGVNYSTIILLDGLSNRLIVQTSNISNPEELTIVAGNINCSVMHSALETGRSILEKSVDPERYKFTAGRGINSLICIPLNSKSRKFGLVLAERKSETAFDEENLRLLNIIAQQVGIAMENAELYQKTHELAIKDGLTGIFNRQYIQERLGMEIEAALKGNYALSLAIFDIDHFKKFNDTFGHLFGDKVLKSIVEAVSESLQDSDIMARFGGEEFMILFPGTKLDEAYEKVETLRKMISKHIIKDNVVTASVTVSFGVSALNECALTDHELIRTADDALYEAKDAGRNCVKVAKRILE